MVYIINQKKIQSLKRYIYYYNLNFFSSKNSYKYNNIINLNLLNNDFTDDKLIIYDKNINDLENQQKFYIRKLIFKKIKNLCVYFITDSNKDFYESYFLVCNRKKYKSYLVDLRFNKEFFFKNNINQEKNEIYMINILINKAKKNKIKKIYMNNEENLYIYNNLLLKFNNIYYFIYNINWYNKNFGFKLINNNNFEKIKIIMNNKIQKFKLKYNNEQSNINKIFFYKYFKKIYKITKSIYFSNNILKL